MFKVNNRNIRTRCKICSKLTIKIPERRHWRRSIVSIVSIVNFEQVNADWYVALSIAPRWEMLFFSNIIKIFIKTKKLQIFMKRN